MQALLGQRLSSNINLIAQMLILVGLWVGFYFARRKQFTRHRHMQTTLVLTNLFFILFVMITSFYSYVILGGSLAGIVARLMIIHGSLGLIAELTGIYLILLMNTKLIPAQFRLQNIKIVMRSLLALWTLVILLGFGIYYYRYLPIKPASGTAMASLLQAADDVQIHADELVATVQRDNLATAKRHAEHLINLVEGRTGADYGDADGNGFVEDPGDGTGALTYLDKARQEGIRASHPDVQVVADQIKQEMIELVTNAKAVIAASDLRAVTSQIENVSRLANQIKEGPTGSVAQLASLSGLQGAAPTAAAPNVTGQADTEIVVMKDFAFVPKDIKVKQGTTVIFVNQDQSKHTVTSDDGKFNSGDILPGKTYSYKFDVVGVFPYYCVFHGDKGGVDMAGTVEVVP